VLSFIGLKLKLTEENNMKKLTLAIALLVVLMSGASTALATSVEGQEKKSLYTRVGGYDALALVVDDFIKRLATDPKFAKFFSGFSVDSQKRLRQHILDQFCKAAGGPCEYVGRDMKTTHTGLGITEAEWDAAAKHLIAAMDKYKVPQAEKDELMAFVATQKKDIVEK
jgi:hemoglobin